MESHSEIESIKNENFSLKQQLDSLNQQLRSSEEQFKKTLEEQRIRINQLEKELETEAASLVQAQKNNVIISEKVQQLTQENSKLKSEVRRLENDVTNLEGSFEKQIEKQKETDKTFWQPDTSSRICSCCSTTFSSIVRRHHCRMCGGLVCDQCSPKIKLAQYGGPKFPAQRTCMKCHPPK